MAVDSHLSVKLLAVTGSFVKKKIFWHFYTLKLGAINNFVTMEMEQSSFP